MGWPGNLTLFLWKNVLNSKHSFPNELLNATCFKLGWGVAYLFIIKIHRDETELSTVKITVGLLALD